MHKIKFAIVGCGKIAERHARHILNLAELVAVCDIEEEKAVKLATQSGAKAYKDFEALLEAEKKVEIVSICTPNGLHAKHTIQALRAGKHVLCEKPLAISAADCRAMIKEAEVADRRLFVVKQNRYNPPVCAVKKAINDNIFGKIYSVQLSCFWNRGKAYYKNSWRGTKEFDGGTLFTQFSHFIDLLYWMFGDVKQAYALSGNFAHKDLIEFEDTGVVAIAFASGALGAINYTVNSHNKNMEGSLTIFAEKGTVKIGGQYLNKLEYQDLEGFEIKDLPEGSTANDYGTYLGSMSNHDKVYESVIDAITNNSANATNAIDGLKTVEIIEMIYASSAKLNAN
jgi:UDP-N-acetyl-2-amino-2-deoxyglucuronate dehydrogenase